MANYYTESSTLFPLSDEHADIATNALSIIENIPLRGDDGGLMDRADIVKRALDENIIDPGTAKADQQAADIAYRYAEARNAQDPSLEIDDMGFVSDRIKGEGITLRNDENIDIESAIGFIQAVQQALGLTEPAIIEWANTCSKPRLGGFGGGAAVVTPEQVEHVNSYQWAHETAAKMKAGSSPQIPDIELPKGKRLHAILPGMGIIIVNRTEEGVIVDAQNNTSEDSLATFYLTNSDFNEEAE